MERRRSDDCDDEVAFGCTGRGRFFFSSLLVIVLFLGGGKRERYQVTLLKMLKSIEPFFLFFALHIGPAVSSSPSHSIPSSQYYNGWIGDKSASSCRKTVEFMVYYVHMVAVAAFKPPRPCSVRLACLLMGALHMRRASFFVLLGER